MKTRTRVSCGRAPSPGTYTHEYVYRTVPTGPFTEKIQKLLRTSFGHLRRCVTHPLAQHAWMDGISCPPKRVPIGGRAPGMSVHSTPSTPSRGRSRRRSWRSARHERGDYGSGSFHISHKRDSLWLSMQRTLRSSAWNTRPLLKASRMELVHPSSAAAWKQRADGEAVPNKITWARTSSGKRRINIAMFFANESRERL